MLGGPYFEQLGRATGEYAVIDLGNGNQWISSRLFIFAVLLKRMTGLRQFVFIGTQNGVTGRFLGMASPDDVRWALARRYPWLECAYAYAYTWHVANYTDKTRQTLEELSTWKATGGLPRRKVMLTTGDQLEPDEERDIALKFLQKIQVHESDRPPDFNDEEWVEGTENGSPYWERATKLDEAWLRWNLSHAADRSRTLVDSPI
jgi:hypothetical protein